MSLRVLIADDEPPARRRVLRLLSSQPEMTVVGQVGSGLEAVSAIESLQPDVVFLDVQMPDLDGFGVLKALNRPWPVVVFVTAYDEYCLRAFDIHAADYLLKPFDDERFQRAVDRVRQIVEPPALEVHRRALTALIDRAAARTVPGGGRLAVRQGESVEMVAIERVLWIESDGNYVTLHLEDGRSVLIRRTLKDLEGEFPADVLRIHRSTLVRLSCVARLHMLFHGEYLVELTDGTRLRSSRTFAPALAKALGLR